MNKDKKWCREPSNSCASLPSTTHTLLDVRPWTSYLTFLNMLTLRSHRFDLRLHSKCLVNNHSLSEGTHSADICHLHYVCQALGSPKKRTEMEDKEQVWKWGMYLMRCGVLRSTLKLHGYLAHSGGWKQLILPLRHLPGSTRENCTCTHSLKVWSLCISLFTPLTSTDLVSQPCQPLSTLLPGSREQIFSRISWWFGGGE